jgi:dynein light chain roadblock-type
VQSAEDVAKMVWGFVNSAGDMVKGLDGDDEMKLVRLRTRKHELVIVPGRLVRLVSERDELLTDVDAKYLLVVIHETPPA